VAEDRAAEPSRRVPRRGILSHWLPAVGWVIVMFVMSSLPDPERVLGPGLQVGDPNAHAIGFFVLMLLWTRLAVFRAGRLSLRAVVGAATACLVYAVIDELHQVPIPGRTFQWADLLSDAVGVALGLAIVVALGWFRARRSGV
jgi:hypothetical protein